MSKNSELPTFGSPDPEGFRTFSLVNPDGDEVLRVSVNIQRTQKYLLKIDNEYLSTVAENSKWETSEEGDGLGKPTEREHQWMRSAAILLAAKEKVFENDEEAALTAVLEIVNELFSRDFETYYPFLAKQALQVASDTCVKHTLNRVLKQYGLTHLYGASAVTLVLADLKNAVHTFLMVDKGRPRETWQRLQDIREALRRLDEKERLRANGKKPTKARVAATLGVSEQTLDSWRSDLGCKTWSQVLRLAGWYEGTRK